MRTTKIPTTARTILAASLAAVFVGNANSPQPAMAARIHLIVACDTTEEANLGADIVADKLAVQRLFQANVPAAQLTTRVIEGKQLSRQSMLTAVKDLRVVKREDSIVFYYTGHGAYDKEREGHFFSLPGKQQLSRNELEKVMIEKEPRAAITITDCCASGARFRGEPIVGKAFGRPTRISPLFERLLLSRCGLFSITSSEPGQNSITRGDGKGSLFTYHFVEFMNDNGKRPLDWDDVIRRVKSTVQTDFAQLTKGKGIDSDGDGRPDQFKQTTHAFMLTPRLGLGAKQTGQALIINQVVPLSPAFHAKSESGARVNIEEGDILLEVNGRPVRTEREYSDAVDNSPRTLTLKVRDGRASNEVVVATALLNE